MRVYAVTNVPSNQPGERYIQLKVDGRIVRSISYNMANNRSMSKAQREAENYVSREYPDAKIFWSQF